MTIRVNRFDISFSSSILPHIYGIYSTGCYDVSKTGNTKSFFKTQFMVHRTK